jgi:hypothetical protein
LFDLNGFPQKKLCWPVAVIGLSLPHVIARRDLVHQCAERFAAARHSARRLSGFEPTARLLIAGQAPGMKV